MENIASVPLEISGFAVFEHTPTKSGTFSFNRSILPPRSNIIRFPIRRVRQPVSAILTPDFYFYDDL
jgi:hypothetical protein